MSPSENNVHFVNDHEKPLIKLDSVKLETNILKTNSISKIPTTISNILAIDIWNLFEK